MSETGRLAALDLVEVNPSLGDSRAADVTVNSGVEVVLAALRYRTKISKTD